MLQRLKNWFFLLLSGSLLISTSAFTQVEKELEEVTITSEQVFWVYPRKQANVLDFILQPNDGILLCCSDQNRYFVRELNAGGEKIFETPIRRNPEILFRDCMERIHLVYSDSIYETYSTDRSLALFQAQPTDFFQLLLSLVYKDSQTLIKRSYSNLDQRIEFRMIDIPTKTEKLLYLAEDRSKANELQTYKAENKLDPTALMSSNAKDLSIARRRWDNLRFYEQVLGKPVYIPLFELNDSLIVFDHLNDSAVVFSKSGRYVRSFPISYQYFDGWKKELIPNIEKTAIYARFEQDGFTSLRKIDLITGKPAEAVIIKGHIYPEHIQIRKDFIYYLSKDYLDRSMHYIFRQHLTTR